MAENKMTIEESFDKLQEIVDTMDDPDISLEDAFAKYKEGVSLVKQCNDMIDKVEKEVKMISENGDTTEFNLKD
ncbi:MAG: exodeoxyribonuclease VII small subunit [Lachnospiraceae bacterium]|jgi:exodeoxyribonuclease VII small subunit|nr:exodeoxyribonuclease VII small subunit [Lachnospiraceae bacterium]